MWQDVCYVVFIKVGVGRMTSAPRDVIRIGIINTEVLAWCPVSEVLFNISAAHILLSVHLVKYDKNDVSCVPRVTTLK